MRVFGRDGVLCASISAWRLVPVVAIRVYVWKTEIETYPLLR